MNRTAVRPDLNLYVTHLTWQTWQCILGVQELAPGHCRCCSCSCCCCCSLLLLLLLLPCYFCCCVAAGVLLQQQQLLLFLVLVSCAAVVVSLLMSVVILIPPHCSCLSCIAIGQWDTYLLLFFSWLSRDSRLARDRLIVGNGWNIPPSPLPCQPSRKTQQPLASIWPRGRIGVGQ